MKKKKLVALLTAVVLSSTALVACGEKKEEKKEDKPSTTATSTLKDGTYKAEYDKADERGWKAFVEVKVADGKISASTFDYVNDKGEMKSKDAGYNKAMEDKMKTSPEKFSKSLPESLVKNQEVSKVETVTGATTSSDDFKTLATKAVDAAKEGKTDVVKVQAPAKK